MSNFTTLITLHSHNIVINDFEDQMAMVEANLRRRPGMINFILKQSFYDRGRFYDGVKEFAILNNFELEHIRIDSQKVTARCQFKNCTWVCTPLRRGTKIL